MICISDWSELGIKKNKVVTDSCNTLSSVLMWLAAVLQQHIPPGILFVSLFNRRTVARPFIHCVEKDFQV